MPCREVGAAGTLPAGCTHPSAQVWAGACVERVALRLAEGVIRTTTSLWPAGCHG